MWNTLGTFPSVLAARWDTSVVCTYPCPHVTISTYAILALTALSLLDVAAQPVL